MKFLLLLISTLFLLLLALIPANPIIPKAQAAACTMSIETPSPYNVGTEMRFRIFTQDGSLVSNVHTEVRNAVSGEIMLEINVPLVPGFGPSSATVTFTPFAAGGYYFTAQEIGGGFCETSTSGITLPFTVSASALIPPTGCQAADLNNDEFVSLAEIGTIVSALNTNNPDYDFNGNGTVDTEDVAMANNCFGPVGDGSQSTLAQLCQHADVNGDGKIDIRDYDDLTNAVASGDNASHWDANGDGQVNNADFARVLQCNNVGYTPFGSPACSPGADCRTGLGTFPTTISAFAGRFLTIAVGLAGGIALILLVYGSIRILTSSGNQQSLQQGREIMVAAIAGLLFLIFAVLILRALGLVIGIPQLIL